MRTSLDKREFLRLLDFAGLAEDQLAEAGVKGVLNTCLSTQGDEGDETEEGEAFGV
jgi:hypothetical protein